MDKCHPVKNDPEVPVQCYLSPRAPSRTELCWTTVQTSFIKPPFTSASSSILTPHLPAGVSWDHLLSKDTAGCWVPFLWSSSNKILHLTPYIRICFWRNQFKTQRLVVFSNSYRPILGTLLSRRNVRLRQGESLVQGHKSCEWQSLGLTMGCWPARSFLLS
jgi:hypothetical protein